MTNDSNRPSRKHPAHGVLHLPHQPTIVFDTVCTKDRRPWLAVDEIHELLRDVWNGATAWLVGRYVIMPDHIHFFAAATESPISCDDWVKYWKSQFSRRHGDPRHSWQTDHWDTRMRNHQQYEEKWNYVRYNPVRRGLVAHPDEWPYQGEIYRLDWE